MLRFACPHCKRADFKSKGGVTQHINRSIQCLEKAKLSVGVPSILDDMQQPKIGERTTKKARIGDDYQVAQAVQLQPSGDDNGHFSDDDDAPMPFGSPVHSDSEPDDDAPLPPPNPRSCTRNRDAFRDYLKYARQHSGDLTEAEMQSVRLLGLMQKNKTPLGAYDDLIEWHYRGSEDLLSHETLADCPHYIGRDSLIKKLSKRYNMVEKVPKVEEIILPSSGSKINIVTQDFRDQLELILTVPVQKSTS